ncbi:hypothetical protein PHYSODRAFT_312563 [Phytophthora sojae]|uniref:Transposase Tc1-like domain-containing protein n=1 Tax=Phytophthora sojae (strain P6497) TaxID=1094619 RepID=G4Z290_PHYSP|nr:hypothetical protein PHYSODRAFT_312563 [Phytophthora sojae]EGZ19234.1 hypothetical protein PHYSODRAFT_312563 [Phytophthora sojae]|eukprot:XP_009521951.1 hypothetical protein PHYSODRAFT_312563 [Phytophthora sojae]
MASPVSDAALEASNASSTDPETRHSNAAEATLPTAPELETDARQPQVETANTTANDGEEESKEKNNEQEEEKEMQHTRHSSARSRDLDMLADTVRSIVTDVVGTVGAPVDKAQSEDKTAVVETVDGSTDVGIDMATTPESEEAVTVRTEAPSVLRDSDKETTDASEVGEQHDEDTLDDTAGSSPKRPPTASEETDRAPKKKKRSEYSDEIRALCVHRHQTEGASYATISKELEIPHDTVRAIVRKARRTGSVSSAPRSGRPRKTSGIVDKLILEAVRANKQCSAKAIQQELLRVFGVKISPETVRRRVLEHTKQRIQSVSGGGSSGVSAVAEDNSESGTAIALEVATPSDGRARVANSSLSDSVSFQQLLNEEAQPASESVNILSLAAATTKGNRDTQPADSSPPHTVSGANSDAPQAQPAEPSQSEDEPAPQKRRRSEYSIETREQCVALRAQGQGYRQIGKVLDMPHTTVRAIVEKAQRTGTVLPAKRSGRPRKTDDIVDKVILQAVKSNEKSSARVIKEQLLAAYGVRISCETIRRRVKDHSRQCMLAASSGGILETLPNDGSAFRQNASQDQGLLAVAMTDSSSMPPANIVAFDENGVHL